MGTILQNRTLRSADTVSIGDPERKKKAAGTKMGRRQSQRKSVPPPQHALPVPERNGEQKLQQRRKQKPRTLSTKRLTTQHSAQGTSEAESASQTYFPPHRLPCSSRDPRETASPDGGSQSGHAQGDSDTDLSDSERLPVAPCSRVPPPLQLRPELIEAEDGASCRPGRNNHGSSDFPDFLPPPFNSWSLGQLAVFYNMEGRGAPRPRPVGPLERYMERMLQLEWRQIRTVQEEGGTPAGSDAVYSCHRAAGAASSRLSSPKCILQCQRSFPLTFLSSLASHCALLSGCACTLCRIRYTACCTTSSCCRSARQSRPSPAPERGSRGPASLPKRSYSESRLHSADRSSACRAQRSGSPTRTNGHLRRMQASGNIRNPAHGAGGKPQATARDPRVGDLSGARGGGSDYRPGGFLRRRSGSEQKRGGVEGQRGAMEKRRSGSECRRGGAERRRAAELREREITPDAVDAIMDNLPGSKNYPINRANRPKQVEFVT
ncbi:uncharacterized protein LOC119229408 [Pungitius pungitius]|uniref:uncharacterized protein LOC119229408 n=1 Tax=Pungitius pungitius TaxID=134920 RepID=UPI002E12556A